MTKDEMLRGAIGGAGMALYPFVKATLVSWYRKWRESSTQKRGG
jgi:hypothetical protein